MISDTYMHELYLF